MKNLAIIFVFATFSQSAQANQINFEELKKCYDWTNFTYMDNQAHKVQSYLTAKFYDKVRTDKMNGQTYEVNALIVKRGNQVTVLQDWNQRSRSGVIGFTKGKSPSPLNATYTLTKPSDKCSTSSSKTVVPVHGFCSKSSGGICSMGNMAVEIGNSYTKPDQTYICEPVILMQGEAKHEKTPKVVDRSEAINLIKESLAERAKFIAEHIQQKVMIPSSDKWMIKAIQENGPCNKVLSPNPTEVAAANSLLLCAVDTKQQHGCIRGDIGPGATFATDPDGNVTMPQTRD